MNYAYGRALLHSVKTAAEHDCLKTSAGRARSSVLKNCICQLEAILRRSSRAAESKPSLRCKAARATDSRIAHSADSMTLEQIATDATRMR